MCIYSCRPVVGLQRVDHIVGNQPNEEMMSVAEWYVEVYPSGW